jgi:hypothetical protein
VLWDDVLQPGPAIGIVRAQRQFIQQGSNIRIRNCEAGRIDRSGERRILQPPPKPSPQQRRLQERLEKLIALSRVEPRPGLHRCLEKITAPHLVSLIQQRKTEKRKTQIC